MKIERPLDMLNNAKGKDVFIILKNGLSISGTLITFDININLVLDNAREIGDIEKKIGLVFVRGDNVIHISQ
jgi:small nuclear ribonucleoprotein (snRNP)-like protein